MISKSRYYLLIVAALLTGGLFLQTSYKAVDQVAWLCSGRFVQDGGIAYDPLLIFLLGLGSIFIAGAYFAIPAVINKLRAARSDIKGAVDDTMVKFIAFIMMCGIGHLIDFANIYFHYYYVSAAWHIGTGIISIDTFLSLRSNADFFTSLPSKTFFQQFQRASEAMQLRKGFGIWWYDTDTGKVRWSSGMKNIYKKPHDWEVDLDVIDKMVHPESREFYDQETARHRSEGGDAVFEYYVTVEGQKRLFKAFVYDAQDGIFGSVVDVTAKTLSGADVIKSMTGNKEERIGKLQLIKIEIEQEIAHLRIN